MSPFVFKLAHCCRGRFSEMKTSVVSGLVKVSGRRGGWGGGRSCLSMGLAGVAEMGGRRTLSPPCRERATCRSGRPDVRGTVFGRRQIPKSGEEDGRVAPDFYLRAVEESLLGRAPGSLHSSELQARVCCGDGRLKSLGYVSLFASQDVFLSAQADGRGGQPGRSRLLPSGSGGESVREGAWVAPFIGTSSQSLLRRRKAGVIRLREPRVSIYVAGRFPFSVG